MISMSLRAVGVARRLAAGSSALVALAFAACGGVKEGGSVQLTGAGATFPYPVYSKWFDTFHRATGHQINYQSIGSGAGVKQFTEGTVDFGATDGPMSDAEIAAVDGAVIHLPAVLGADVVTWNLPSLDSTRLRFDGATLADIFMGKIKRWDDARIAALNPGVRLPALDILVVHRSDGSGTTFIWTDYLSTVSPEWSARIGRGKSVNWPTGIGGKGNEGVTQQVKQVEGAIGYVELIYAMANDMPYAAVRNKSGAFVAPTLESVSAAAAGVELAADTDFRVSIVDAEGAAAYPVASFTWLLVKPDVADAAKARALRDFLAWMTSDEAARMAAELHYAPLPATVKRLVIERVGTLTTGGAPIPDGT
jgi:phosphate transport system substrate-binding protein